MKTARIVIYIALALSIGVAALAQHNGETTLIPSTSRSRMREPLNPEHPGLKSETWATHSRFVRNISFLRRVAGPWTMRREGIASSAVLLRKTLRRSAWRYRGNGKFAFRDVSVGSSNCCLNLGFTWMSICFKRPSPVLMNPCGVRAFTTRILPAPASWITSPTTNRDFPSCTITISS